MGIVLIRWMVEGFRIFGEIEREGFGKYRYTGDGRGVKGL